MGIGGAVVFRGTRADITEIIAALNLLIIPREVSGSVGYALQAVALEVPVIAVRTPALAAVLEPVDSEAFVPPDDATALAATLSRRLEILPPPNDDAYAEFGGFSRGDMLVSGMGFDLDGIGLEAEWRGDESDRRLAVRRAQERFSIGAVARGTFAIYDRLLQR
jgi:glycosyltransferase involved in cell wall biosynthesis